MKKTYFILAVFILLFFENCESPEVIVEKKHISQKEKIINEIKEWYQSPMPTGLKSKRETYGKHLLERWEDASINQLNRETYLVTIPIFKSKSYGVAEHQLIVFYNPSKINGYVVQITPDKEKQKNKLSGEIKIRARNGEIFKTLKFKDGRKVLNNTTTLRTSSENQIAWTSLLPEVEITSYQYDMDRLIALWFDYEQFRNYMLNNDIPMDDMNLQISDQGGNGTMDVYIPVPPTDPLYDVGGPDPAKIIDNRKTYFGCFDSWKSATLIIYVDQPSYNSAECWVFANAGHTFIGLQQEGNNRTFGFYGVNGGDIVNKQGDGVLAVNDDHFYNVSYTEQISPEALEKVLALLTKKPLPDYHLDKNNCTDFAMEIAKIAGIGIPPFSSTWPNGPDSGHCPGGLGEAIKGLITLDIKKYYGKIYTAAWGGRPPKEAQNCSF
jgi:hypothetical protein